MPNITTAARVVKKPIFARPPVTFITDLGKVEVPDGIVDIDRFREWADSDNIPEKLRVWWLQGEVWIDMSKEQLFWHVRLKTHIAAVLSLMVDATDTGVVFGDGAHLTNLEADISGNPDAIYVSHEAFQSGRVKRIEGKKRGFVELEGVPDMVLEVMSASSVKKDATLLKAAYATAGIREYWLVDACVEPLQFDIFRLAAKGYVAGRKRDGWIQSPVFDKSFRLVQGEDGSGNPKFTLEVRN
jgi:Uma2 family endonuclease